MIPFILIVCAIACSVLASLVIFQDFRKPAYLAFVGICACFAIWCLSVLVFLSADSEAVAFAAAKIFYFVAALFPALLLIFALMFPSESKKVPKYIYLSVGITGALISTLALFSPIFVLQKVVISDQGNYGVIDLQTYVLYSTYFIAIFGSAMFVALRKFMMLRGNLRMQAGLYAFGILLNSIPGFITNLYLPAYSDFSLIWVGPALSVFFLSLTGYSIIKHGLFSIRIAAVRSTAYLFTLCSLIGVYYVLAYVIAATLSQLGLNEAVSLGPVNIALALILALIFQPVRTFFDKVTNKVFFRDAYSTDDFFARLNSMLTSSADLRPLLRKASQEIGNALKSEQIFFHVLEENGSHITVGSREGLRFPVKDALFLQKEYKDENTVIVASLLPAESATRRMMASHRLELIMPLQKSGALIGYLCVGHHRTSRYTQRDLRLLQAIADELVIAIQNALSLQEVKDLNASLEQRIATATKELRASNAQLQRLDEVKDEFMSMASHQLRTPLTSIKGYVSMLLEGDAGAVKEEQAALLREAFNSSERMVRLIGDFLNVSRLQTGKFVLDKHPVDLVKLVQSELDSLKQTAISRGHVFEYVQAKGVPVIEIDENKMQQVIMNFADNALYYSKDPSTIKVSLQKVNNWIEFKIKDTGIGVPKEQQEQLFGKFFRATNARKQRPDGTGVGLFLAKKVVDAHHGEIIFSSTEGKGSTFGFRLPIE